jgi:hypothetical protein
MTGWAVKPRLTTAQRPAASSPRPASSRSLPHRCSGWRSENTPAARGNRAWAVRCRTEQPSRRERARPYAGNPCSTRATGRGRGSSVAEPSSGRACWDFIASADCPDTVLAADLALSRGSPALGRSARAHGDPVAADGPRRPHRCAPRGVAAPGKGGLRGSGELAWPEIGAPVFTLPPELLCAQRCSEVGRAHVRGENGPNARSGDGERCG